MRILLITQDRPLHESRVRDTLHALHRLYVDTVSGPFVSIEDPSEALRAPTFLARLDAITEAASASLPYDSK